MSPWKVILATMVIFVCGLVSGVLIVKTTEQDGRAVAPVVEASAAPASSNFPAQVVVTSNVVTKTNVVFAPFQQQRIALIRQMVNRLKLDPDQKENITEILKESQERSRQIWQQIAPQMRDEMKRVTDEIRGQLRPGQARHFMELLRENRRQNRPASVGTNGAAPPVESTNAPESGPA